MKLVNRNTNVLNFHLYYSTLPTRPTLWYLFRVFGGHGDLLYGAIELRVRHLVPAARELEVHALDVQHQVHLHRK